MDYSAIIERFISELQADPLFAIAVLVIASLVIYRRPQFFLGIILLGVVLVSAYYFIMGFAGEGVAEKQKMIRQEKVPGNFISPVFDYAADIIRSLLLSGR